MKLFFKILIFSYLIISGAYFAYKYFFKEEVSKVVKHKIEKKVSIPEKKSFEIPKKCKQKYIGYYVAYDKTFRIKVKNKCFKKGNLALAIYNSEPFSILDFQHYKGASSVGNQVDDLYAVFSIKKAFFKEKPDDGDYILLIFNYDLKKFNNARELNVSREDKKTVERLADTIYYKNISAKTAYTTKLEYQILKSNISKHSNNDLIALVNWFPKHLPKGTIYTALFVLYRGSAKSIRFDVIPIIKSKNIRFDLFQVIDINGDGIKELIVKKTVDNSVSFLIYRFSPDFGYKKVDELDF